MVNGQASLTFAKSNNKKTKPKSVIQKYNKASEVCSDIATFLSTCGQTEFEEKLTVLMNLKTECQCSQITHNHSSQEMHSARYPVHSENRGKLGLD